jgi:copper chaperone CopZ
MNKMKRMMLFTMIIFIGATAGKSFAQKKGNDVAYFKSNMDCPDCELALNEYLKFEKGVKDLKVDHASNTIYIEFKSKKNTSADLAKAIEKKGYKAEKITKEEYKKFVAHAQEHGHDHGAEVHRERN